VSKDLALPQTPIAITVDIGNVSSVRMAYANITLPNGDFMIVNLSNTGGNTYTGNFTNTSIHGSYSVQIVVTDLDGNENVVKKLDFTIGMRRRHEPAPTTTQEVVTQPVLVVTTTVKLQTTVFTTVPSTTPTTLTTVATTTMAKTIPMTVATTIPETSITINKITTTITATPSSPMGITGRVIAFSKDNTVGVGIVTLFMVVLVVYNIYQNQKGEKKGGLENVGQV